MLPLRELTYQAPEPAPATYPHHLPALSGFQHLPFTQPVTFFIGDNGSGKSTLLESLAAKAGFHAQGGSHHANYPVANTDTHLADALRLIWNRKVSNGFFFRAESFFAYASYVDELAQDSAKALQPFGGVSLHHRSHGESFLALFQNRLDADRPALYLFDEPEAALSITGQLALLRIMHRWAKSGHVQVIVATHSPILLAFPKAAIWTFDTTPLSPTTYRESAPYQVTRAFLEDPERIFHELFSEDDE